MFLHAIVLTAPSDGIAERINQHHPKHYRMNHTVYLVRSDDISEKIATDIGLKGERQVEGATGAVFKLNGTYSGYAPTSLWEWLEV